MASSAMVKLQISPARSRLAHEELSGRVRGWKRAWEAGCRLCIRMALSSGVELRYINASNSSSCKYMGPNYASPVRFMDTIAELFGHKLSEMAMYSVAGLVDTAADPHHKILAHILSNLGNKQTLQTEATTVHAAHLEDSSSSCSRVFAHKA